MVSVYKKTLGAVAAAASLASASPSFAQSAPKAPTVSIQAPVTQQFNQLNVNGGAISTTLQSQQTTLVYTPATAVTGNNANVFNGIKNSGVLAIQGATAVSGAANLANTFAAPGVVKNSTLQLQQTTLALTQGPSLSQNDANLGKLSGANVTVVQGATSVSGVKYQAPTIPTTTTTSTPTGTGLGN